MNMDIPDKKIHQYNKVWMLIETNSPESPAAKNILANLERQYQGIAEAARIYRLSEEEPETQEEEIHTRHWSDVYQPKPPPPTWERVKKAANGAFSWASDMAQHAFGVHEAQFMAKEFVAISSRDNRSGSLTINVRIPPAILWKAIHEFTPEQKTVFANTVMHDFMAEINDILYEDID
jgi:hypothetical protein